MAINDIDDLRSHFPANFLDRDPTHLDDQVLRFPTTQPQAKPSSKVTPVDEEPPQQASTETEDWDELDEIEKALLNQPLDEPLEKLPEGFSEAFGGHPGGAIDNPDTGGTATSTAIERLAFYLPFHFYPRWWGIYIFPEGIQRIRQEMRGFFLRESISPINQIRIAKTILYHHEFYHHAIESFSVRIETVLNSPAYITGFTNLYKSTAGTINCLEETCANSYARQRTLESKCASHIEKRKLRDAIDAWFRGAPPGYAQAAGTGGTWKDKIRPRLYEDCMDHCLPPGQPKRKFPPAMSQVAWATAGHFDRAIGDIDSRIFYLIPKGSPLHNRLPTDARTCIKTREFKRRISDLGLGRFHKQGSNHEIWLPSSGKKPVPIPRHNGSDLSKDTMRKILSQLGSSLSIEQFLAS